MHLPSRAKFLISWLALSGLAPASLAAATSATVSVDFSGPGKAIGPDLVGTFFEDLNYAADGGLYAELIQNRSFEYSATERADWGPLSFWKLVKTGEGDGHLGLGNARPVHVNNPHYLPLTVLAPGGGVGVGNEGFGSIPLEAGRHYVASFWAYRTYMGREWSGSREDPGKPMPVPVRLEGRDGKVLAQARLGVSGREWTKHTVTLSPSRADRDARFVLLAHEQGELALDMISLFPRDTFKGRINGLRPAVRPDVHATHLTSVFNYEAPANSLTVFRLNRR